MTTMTRAILASAFCLLATACGSDRKEEDPGAPPTEPTSLGQFYEDGVTRIPKAGVTGESTVLFHATLAPASARTSVRLEIEVVPAGTPFTGSVTASSTYGGGGFAQIPMAFPNAGDYAWKAWAQDSLGRRSQEVTPSGALFTVDPSAPRIPRQALLSGVLLPVGERTTDGGIGLRAHVRSSDDQMVRAQFEVKPSSTAFDGTGLIMGTCVPTRSDSEATAWLTPGPCHWRVRTERYDGQTSLWVGFGGNDDAVLDIDAERVSPPTVTNPPAPTDLWQYHTDGAHVIPPGGITAEDKVILKATASGLSGLLWAVEVEVKSFGVPFDGTGIVRGNLVPDGSPSQIAVPVGAGDYHWQARAVMSTGEGSAWASFSPYGSGMDFRCAPSANVAPGAPTDLALYNNESYGYLYPADSTWSNTMRLKATVSDPDEGNGLVLEVEVRPSGVPFANVPTHASGLLMSGGTAWLDVLGFSGMHHWQARTVDAAGATSAWVAYAPNPSSTSTPPAPSTSSTSTGGGSGGGGCSGTVAVASGSGVSLWALMAAVVIGFSGRRIRRA